QALAVNRGKKHLGIEPIGILLAQALGAIAGTGTERAVAIMVGRRGGRNVLVVAQAAVEVADVIAGPLVHHPHFTAVGLAHQPRRLVLILRGDTGGPIKWYFKMPVRGNSLIRSHLRASSWSSRGYSLR